MNVETIRLEDGDDHMDFRVFHRLPVPIAREVQTLFNEMAENFEGSIEDLESGEVKAKDAKNLKIECLHEIHDILLTKAVIDPPIKKEDIANINEPLQIYFQDLADLLLEKYTLEKKKIKKKSMNSPN